MELTSREKAAEIYNKCLLYIDSSNKISAKACAYICADEIMKDAESNFNEDARNYEHTYHYKYWEKVKKEIQKI